MPRSTTRQAARALRPSDYLSKPDDFGRSRSARVTMPDGGDGASQRAAFVQHQAVLRLRDAARPGTGPGAVLGREFGFSRQHWSDCLSGRSWMRDDALLAALALLLGIVHDLPPAAGDVDRV